MRTISTRLIAGLLDVLDARQIPVAPLFEGLHYSEAYFRTGNERVEWEVATEILGRTAQQLPPNESMRSIGRGIITSESFSRVATLVSYLADSWQLFRVMRLWLAPLLVPAASRRYQETNEGEIIIYATLPLDNAYARLYFEMIQGVLEHAPSLVDAPDAHVELIRNGREILFRIQPPPVDPERQLLLTESETATLASTALRELIDQQIDAQTTWETLRSSILTLNERSQRLEAFGRLSHALAEKLELSELARVILTVMVVDFDFQGGVLELALSNGETLRWGMGQRESHSDITYPFNAPSQFRGKLELWGSPNYIIGGDNDSVASIMPWLLLALTNAIAFQTLEAERQRSDERLLQLEAARDELEVREREYRLLVEDASDAISVFSLSTGRFSEANRATTQTLGYSRDELLTMTLFDILEPADINRTPLQRDELLAGKTVRKTRLALTRTGAVVAVETATKLIDHDRVQLIARDVTQWRLAKEQLRESEERYALAVRGANDGLWDWNLRTGQMYFSPRWKQMLGYDDKEVETSPDEWFGRVHPEDIPLVRIALRDHFDGDAEHFVVEHRIRRKDGQWSWVLARGLAVRDDSGQAYRMAGSQTEITEQKNFEAQLYHSAFHDNLTALPNRAWVMKWLQDNLNSPESNNFAVLYFDLDRFKVVNDSLGHAVGDRLLTHIATRLEEALADVGHVARIGGDEFVVMIQAIDQEEEAELAAQRIIASVQEPIMMDNRELVLSCSIGITTRKSNRYDTPEELIRDADLAMYAAKAAGRNRFEHYTQSLHTAALEKMHLEVSLRKAIETGALELAYQPIVHGDTRTIVGLEALARWPNNGNPISPAVFIPLAEESGLIHPLGSWVMRTAAKQIMAWREHAPDLRLSVNLSPRQFAREDIVDEVRTLIHDLQLPAGVLALEITENALIDDSENSITRIQALRDAGALIHIDDFGTGYSSLSYLVRLPFDAFKIDRSFVIGLEHDKTKRKIVRSLLRLALSLDAHVVVEGIETEAAMHTVLQVSPDVLLQGNYFSAATSPKTIEAMLTAPTEGFRSTE